MCFVLQWPLQCFFHYNNKLINQYVHDIQERRLLCVTELIVLWGYWIMLMYYVSICIIHKFILWNSIPILSFQYPFNLYLHRESMVHGFVVQKTHSTWRHVNSWIAKYFVVIIVAISCSVACLTSVMLWASKSIRNSNQKYVWLVYFLFIGYMHIFFIFQFEYRNLSTIYSSLYSTGRTVARIPTIPKKFFYIFETF